MLATETELFFDDAREYDAAHVTFGPNWSGRIEKAIWVDVTRCLKTKEDAEKFSEFLLKVLAAMEEWKKELPNAQS